MINKIAASPEAALADVPDGATVMIHGFGNAGMPAALIEALIAQGARDLTIVNNNAGNGDTGLAALIKAKRVRKILCSFPRQADSWHFDAQYRSGEIELELVPQGTLAERIRAAGAGIGAFYTPTAYGTRLAEGKETRRIGERDYVLEYPIHADYALIKADRADRWGNLTYRKSARNFGPIMAAAAKTAVVQVREIVELGSLDPETIVTPSIFVQRVVRVAPAIGEVAPAVGAIGLDERVVGVNRILENVITFSYAPRFFALGEARAVCGRRVEGADARAGGANALGERALGNELELDLARAVLRVEVPRVRLPRKRAQDFAHALRLDERRKPGVAVACIVIDDRQVARALRDQSFDERGGHSGIAEAVDHDRGAIGHVRERRLGARCDFVDHGAGRLWHRAPFTLS